MPTSFSDSGSLYSQLITRLRDVRDIQSAAAVLQWDRATYMPLGGAAARGRQLATLRQVAHEKLCDPALGEILEQLDGEAQQYPYESDEASLIRVARRDYEQATRVPAGFMARLSHHQTESYLAWAEAREAGTFERVCPYLEKTLDLSREWASFFPDCDRPADSLIALSDEGMTSRVLEELFSQLRGELVPIVQAIAAAPPIDTKLLQQEFPETAQLNFCAKLMERIGYDFSRGRQDATLHPFTTSFSINDVRITTRTDLHNLTESLFCSLHEMGHALYEQNIDLALEATPLADGTSSGIHESQSRLWENLVGRSRAFWECFYPRLQGFFLRQLGQSSVCDFYRAINRVACTPIRTAADEVTYNLHVMIRFELEVAMLEGKLSVEDLPEAWNSCYKRDLGITPTHPNEGVLQDVHWYAKLIGGQFQGYTLGNLIASQLFETALKEHPEIPVDLERGNFSTLLTWLQRNVYRHGRKFTADELVDRITGMPIHIDPFLRYIRSKYGDLYDLDL